MPSAIERNALKGIGKYTFPFQACLKLLDFNFGANIKKNPVNPVNPENPVFYFEDNGKLETKMPFTAFSNKWHLLSVFICVYQWFICGLF